MTEPSQLANSAFMVGKVWHKRLLPREHEFAYSIFYGLFDLDELNELAAKSKLFSVNKFNLLSLFPKDYTSCTKTRAKPGQLKEELQKLIADQFGEHVQRIELLTLPRVLGYAFNPISVFYCYANDGLLTHVIYQVNNTFGERISYAFQVDSEGKKVQRHECQKALHVSPFFDVSGGYRFRNSKTEKGLSLTIDYVSQSAEFAPSGTCDKQTGAKAEKSFIASMSLKRKSFTSENLVNLCCRIPFVTLKVIAAIHWQALLLWVKKHRVFQNPRHPK